MKIKLLVSRAGVSFSQNVGEIIEVDAAEAKRMIAAQQAEAVERATKKAAAEKAVK